MLGLSADPGTSRHHDVSASDRSATIRTIVLILPELTQCITQPIHSPFSESARYGTHGLKQQALQIFSGERERYPEFGSQPVHHSVGRHGNVESVKCAAWSLDRYGN